MTFRTLAVPALLGVLAVGMTACGEQPLPDDGTQGIPLAGLGPQLDDAGVEVLSADQPYDASADEVESALLAAEVVAVTVTRPTDLAGGAVAFEADATAGLLDLVTDGQGTTVVLVFSSPDAAAVFAASDPEIFADAASEQTHDAFLSGNLVGYAGPGAVRSNLLRAALESVADPSAFSSTSTSASSPAS